MNIETSVMKPGHITGVCKEIGSMGTYKKTHYVEIETEDGTTSLWIHYIDSVTVSNPNLRKMWQLCTQ